LSQFFREKINDGPHERDGSEHLYDNIEDLYQMNNLIENLVYKDQLEK